MSDKPRFRESGAIVLIRGHGQHLEVYWVRRGDQVSFMPGFYAFPGGIVGPGDADLPIDGASDDRERALLACAIRETFEEIGVLVASAGVRDVATLAEVRERVLCGEATFAALASEFGWRFDGSELAAAGRWRTPAFSSMRFEATYFLARAPEGASPEISDDELAEGEWIAPAEALERWQAGDAVFAAPILSTLREIAAGESALASRLAAAPEHLGDPHRIELSWGIVLQPMPTRALPPATHTNAYLVGDREMALIDPGSGDPAEIEALCKLIGRLGADGRTLTRILLTHAHGDHIGGVSALRARYNIPVYGHALIGDRVALDGTLTDGEVISLAAARDSWDLRVLHTPGHARGHLCFLHERTGALLSGDHIVGAGTVIIDPPEGDMAAYMASLERLSALPLRTLFPAHGSPSGAPHRRIRALIVHRHEREQRVIEALGAEPATLAELLPRAYADVAAALWPYAERSMLAHLLKLERDGRALRDGERWRRGSSRGPVAGAAS